MFLCTQSLFEHIALEQYTFPTCLKMLLSYRQLGRNAPHIVIVLKFFTLVCNVKSLFVEVVNFRKIKVVKFCKDKLITAYFKVFDRKDAKFVVSKSER